MLKIKKLIVTVNKASFSIPKIIKRIFKIYSNILNGNIIKMHIPLNIGYLNSFQNQVTYLAHKGLNFYFHKYMKNNFYKWTLPHVYIIFHLLSTTIISLVFSL